MRPPIPRADGSRAGLPEPVDVRLRVDVSDSSLGHDRRPKGTGSGETVSILASRDVAFTGADPLGP